MVFKTILDENKSTLTAVMIVVFCVMKGKKKYHLEIVGHLSSGNKKGK
jgi:hypothetical protein